MYCNQVGKYRPNQSRPISVTFQNREDKDQLMLSKSNIPPGLYVNHEYSPPPHIKKTRDRLHPILHFAKMIPSLKDKSKMEDDYLVINGTRYGIDEINKLPEEVAAYKSVQKTEDHTLAFHREFSPFSNFHPCHFTTSQQPFHCMEQFLQYQKALMFGNSVTANQILQCENAFEAKRLGYHINRWYESVPIVQTRRVSSDKIWHFSQDI